MIEKIPILLITHDRPHLLPKVLDRLIKYTDFNEFELWILDNDSTPSNSKIIKAYKNKYPWINVYSQSFNQIAIIQNEIIKKLRRDIYIKIDDDILVTENWTKGFINLHNRKKDISIGSVVIPINGFGCKYFLEIMGLMQKYNEKFSHQQLIQGFTESQVYWHKEICLFIWENCLELDKTSTLFIENQNSNFQDLICNYRYFIGAISFSHDFWEKMGHWKVDNTFLFRYKLFLFLSKVNFRIAKLRGREKQNRVQDVIDSLTQIHKSMLGIEEAHQYVVNNQLGLKQYITTESLVYHFAFQPVDYFLMENIFLRIKF